MRETEFPVLHCLKTVAPFYNLVKERTKRDEIRKNDRDFRVGDFLELQEFIPEGKKFTGKRIYTKITKILAEELKFCLKQDFVMLCLKFKEEFSQDEIDQLNKLTEQAE